MSRIIIAMPCLLQGGTEIQTLHLAKALLRLNHEVIIICYYEYLQEIYEEFKSNDIKVILLNWKRGIDPIRFVKDINTLFTSLKPEFIHIQYFSPGLLPIIGAYYTKNVTVFATVHQPCPPGIKARCFLRLASLLTTRFICVSQAVERSWFGRSNLFTPGDALPRRSHFTIYNAIDLEDIRQIVSSEEPVENSGQSAPKHGMVIGAVSRLRHEKGMDILLQAFALLLPRFPGLRLMIVGDGPDRETLHHLAGELSISGVITWAGSRTREEAIRIMQEMDVVVIPSRFEGFGLIAIEAMALGKPVIASNTGGLPEIIDDRETGLLVPPEDPIALAEALTELIDNPALREKLGAAGRRKVGEKFSFNTFARQIEALYAAKQ